MKLRDMTSTTSSRVAPTDQSPPADIVAIEAYLGPADYSDTRDHAYAIQATAIALVSCVIWITVLRILVRWLIVKKLALDDLLLSIGTLCTMCCCGITIHAVKIAGFGRHWWFDDIHDPDIIHRFGNAVKALYLMYIFYSIAAGFTKLSIIVSYVRIVKTPKFKYSMYTMAFVVCGLMVSAIPVIVFQRDPPASAWDPLQTPTERKLNYMVYLWISGGLGIAIDVFLTITPIPVFWKIQMPKRQKITLTVLFCLSISAAIAATFRLKTVNQIQRGKDLSFNAATSALWSVIECSIGIICVSIPSLRPLCDAVTKHKFFRSSEGKDSIAEHQFDLPLYSLQGRKGCPRQNIKNSSRHPNETVETIEPAESPHPSMSSLWTEGERWV
ncbi:hypothetical protein EJ05DRAFT_5250 [Pseudovirgaria hyperparasitica]|uniref:Rhodopsin domain-containing protein n=1 Tax=Pseudovirgaria hyperparasitica TaxID=470096 RepID=A0A6A6WJE1_9PEZI|nr:uncharacterized protein EJ05DRAFT_5250 [Pseudovirgaria hyperparasitica]KAF2762539.1 hypothetical protein EJ05DRAFT_5250 [Pseudovirgaria hyperparasitica]